jgi:D-alanine transaminase
VNNVYLNGDYLAAQDAMVSVFDRGFLLGDGVYEVIPVYNSVCFELPAHLQRLQNSLDGIRMKNPQTLSEWEAVISKVVKLNGGGDQSVYLQVTRGVAPRDHVFPEGVEPSAFVMSNPLQPVSDTYLTQGISAITLPDIRWQKCDVKAITLLPNSLLKQQALEAGAQEALLIRDGYLTEGAASNAYVVKNGIIYTAAKTEKILPGITRDVVISLAKNNDIDIVEQAVAESELSNADELWVSSSTKEILPITVLNGEPIGGGIPGPVWTKMHTLYQHNKMKG